MSKIYHKLLAIAVNLIIAVSALTVLSLSVFAQSETDGDRISTVGKYRGYSDQVYPNVERSSQYITVRDGTKLAADIYRPVDMDGNVVEEPLPVLFNITPYNRNTPVLGLKEWFLDVVKYGYVVAVIDTRGRGASYGPYLGSHRRIEAWDGYDLTEWFAVQPWSDGNIGMLGCSYKGAIQLMIASTRPPHLKAIFAGCHDFQKYGSHYRGGIYQDVRWAGWAAGTGMVGRGLDSRPVDKDTELVNCPIDGKSHPKMQCEAVAEHRADGFVDEVESFASIPYSNMYSDSMQSFYWTEASVASYFDDINRSGIGIYLYGGWWDVFARDQLLEYKNLPNSKIFMTPTPHCAYDVPSLDFNIAEEHVRWFDYWLKDIDNGVMDEPRVAYYPANTEDGQWRMVEDWPSASTVSTSYYLGGDTSGSVNSVNDGALTTTKPDSSSDKDDYTVDFTAASGLKSSFNLNSRPDQTMILDEKGLTYTTPVLDADVEVTGHPVVHLWISSTAADGDFFAYLEEVDGDGKSNYVAFGALRASNRAVREPWYDNLGLPWHPGFEEDQMDLVPGEPTELVFDLDAISYIFKNGHRIRLTITGADLSLAARAPKPSPAPVVTLYRNEIYDSHIKLPIIPGH